MISAITDGHLAQGYNISIDHRCIPRSPWQPFYTDIDPVADIENGRQMWELIEKH